MARKIKITPAFKVRLSEKLMDLGNYVLVGLVISQLAIHQLSPDLFIIGVVCGIELYLAAYIIKP
jgi:hypothetical protein